MKKRNNYNNNTSHQLRIFSLFFFKVFSSSKYSLFPGFTRLLLGNEMQACSDSIQKECYVIIVFKSLIRQFPFFSFLNQLMKYSVIML